jgi:hypothetical protein
MWFKRNDITGKQKQTIINSIDIERKKMKSKIIATFAGPGIYHTAGRTRFTTRRANDLVFWNTHLVVDDLSRQVEALRANGTRFVSKLSARVDN